MYKTTNSTNDFQLMCKSLLDIEIFINTNIHSVKEKCSIYDNNSKRLFEIAQCLRKNSKVKIDTTRKAEQLINDVLDNAFLYTSNTLKILEFINNIFTEFMKGITYFQINTSVNRPIYHRDKSCGLRNELHLLNCLSVYNDSDEFTKRSKKVRNCYIERLIYDIFFTKYFPSHQQNFNHKAMLLNTGRGNNKFETCFPNTTLDIDITWSLDNLFPIKLQIQTVSPGKSKIETYIKKTNSYNSTDYNVSLIDKLKIDVSNIYDTDIVCNRNIHDRETHSYIMNEKIQTFNIEKEWVETLFLSNS
jgi:hypothetical protein